MHKRCSGVKGSLKKVEGVFRCKMCVQGHTEEVAESMNNVVERVESFGYLGDKLNAAGGCLCTVTSRVRVELGGVLWKEVVSDVEGKGI